MSDYEIDRVKTGIPGLDELLREVSQERIPFS